MTAAWPQKHKERPTGSIRKLSSLLDARLDGFQLLLLLCEKGLRLEHHDWLKRGAGFTVRKSGVNLVKLVLFHQLVEWEQSSFIQ